ncbi:MAG: hypothetical protein C0613_01375 [Desulfobulbaceae bacterium]|nr:MAG: hypothetical protein C0613_01375 [Desulfobulbaceae bacterium]
MRFHDQKIILLILLLVALSALSGCRRPPLPAPGPVIIDDGHPGRRPHQRSRYYRYRYFPAYEIYYDTSRRLYFYFSDGRWLSVRVLPRHYHIDARDYVIVELEGLKPHVHHRQMIKRYPPHKYRKEERREKRHQDKGRYDDQDDRKQQRHDKEMKRSDSPKKRQEHDDGRRDGHSYDEYDDEYDTRRDRGKQQRRDDDRGRRDNGDQDRRDGGRDDDDKRGGRDRDGDNDRRWRGHPVW